MGKIRRRGAASTAQIFVQRGRPGSATQAGRDPGKACDLVKRPAQTGIGLTGSAGDRVEGSMG
jgi:hypothetical protein